MKFTVAGSRIICSRKDNTVADVEAYRRVVEFDAHVESLPAHVSAKLTTSEIEQLKELMADRKRIQANPAAKNMLEALPGLLAEATDVLNSVERVNESMYHRLTVSITNTSRALEKVKPVSQGEPTPAASLRYSEAQKNG